MLCVEALADLIGELVYTACYESVMEAFVTTALVRSYDEHVWIDNMILPAIATVRVVYSWFSIYCWIRAYAYRMDLCYSMWVTESGVFL
jgi:hypothetical protein